MAKKIDGVVEGVRYAPDGTIQMARVYERRGPTWSDRVLLDRETLMGRLKAGKRYSAGKRQIYMASTFDLGKALRVNRLDGREFIQTREHQVLGAHSDLLDGVPLF